MRLSSGARYSTRCLAAMAGSSLLLSCFSSKPAPILLNDVPFLEQPPDRCGAASVAMVAQRLGFQLDPAALDRDIFIPALSGTVPDVMAEGARRHGLAARVAECSNEDLAQLLREGIPPIVMLGPEHGDLRGHFVVATGLNPRTGALRVHSGKSRDRWLSQNAWLPRWLQARRRVVIITKP